MGTKVKHFLVMSSVSKWFSMLQNVTNECFQLRMQRKSEICVRIVQGWKHCQRCRDPHKLVQGKTCIVNESTHHSLKIISQNEEEVN